MAYKIFLDTNIIIDYLIENRPEHKNAVVLFEKIIEEETYAYTSETVINTSSYLLAKYIQAKKLKTILDEMLHFVHILQSNNNTFHRAYLLENNDLEDAVLYQIALENEIDYFITSDVDLSKKLHSKKLPILSSAIFLKKL
jgi:putative PIN family toxin of toxin-antitoxin system